MNKIEQCLKDIFTKRELKKYNLLIIRNRRANFIHKKYGKTIYKELKNVEIESKFELSYDDSKGLIGNIKRDFEEGNVKGYTPPKHFPFIIKTSSFNLYFNYLGKVVKILFGYRKTRSNIKSNLRTVKNKFKLNNVSVRSEFKGRDRKYIEKVIKNGRLINGLYRRREAIWVDNISSGRTYHITLDYCYSKKQRLCELEVEYTGNYQNKKASSNERKQIVNDVALLTAYIKKAYPFLKESTLTKEQWLRGKCA